MFKILLTVSSGTFFAELGNQAQYNKDDNDCNVQTVAQQKVTAIKCVLVVFPLLRQRLANRKLGQAQHIDQVIFVIKRSMPAVLDCLAVLIQLHFGIEQAVLVDILFVLDFLLIAQLGKRRLVFLFQLFYSCLIFLLGLYLFLLAAGHHRLVIVAVIMGFQIGFGISDQLVDLALVFFLQLPWPLPIQPSVWSHVPFFPARYRCGRASGYPAHSGY